MAIEIKGNWIEGYAIDKHTLSSIPIGENEHGHMQFETTRSEIGELIYQLKYRSNTTVVPDIVGHMNSIKFSEAIDCIIPLPPSKARKIQPVPLIAREYGKATGLQVLENVIFKDGRAELKDIEDLKEREELLRDSIRIAQDIDLEGKNILLIDDVFRSGATLRVTTDILNGARVKGVYVMTMTKTRINR